jgi:hypothetical protein
MRPHLARRLRPRPAPGIAAGRAQQLDTRGIDAKAAHLMRLRILLSRLAAAPGAAANLKDRILEMTVVPAEGGDVTTVGSAVLTEEET